MITRDICVLLTYSLTHIQINVCVSINWSPVYCSTVNLSASLFALHMVYLNLIIRDEYFFSLCIFAPCYSADFGPRLQNHN